MESVSYGKTGLPGGLTRFRQNPIWGQLRLSPTYPLACPTLQYFNSLQHLLVGLLRLSLFDCIVGRRGVFVLIRHWTLFLGVSHQNVRSDSGILNRFTAGCVVL